MKEQGQFLLKNKGIILQNLNSIQLLRKEIFVRNMIILIQKPYANRLHAHRRLSKKRLYSSHQIKRIMSLTPGIFLFHLITAHLNQYREILIQIKRTYRNRLKVIRICIQLKMKNVQKNRIKQIFFTNKLNLL